VVGEHKGYRVESRLPGGDVNPYLGYAATIAAGLHGIENRIEAPEMFTGNAYEAKDAERVPSSLHEALGEMERSEVMREAFGDLAYGHLVNMARQEQIIFDNNCVTDWELARYFERG
jgi:glutamine synthetase